jgi:hypothetical protein
VAFVVLYDACVLYPAPLRDLLVRLANTGIVRARWSEPILDECFRNIRSGARRRCSMLPNATSCRGRIQLTRCSTWRNCGSVRRLTSWCGASEPERLEDAERRPSRAVQAHCRRAAPADQLRAIRLYPPDHEDYFVELLNVPEAGAAAPRSWVAVKLDDGWYGLPSFEFLALLEVDRERSPSGLEYASPSRPLAAPLSASPVRASRSPTAARTRMWHD